MNLEFLRGGGAAKLAEPGTEDGGPELELPTAAGAEPGRIKLLSEDERSTRAASTAGKWNPGRAWLRADGELPRPQWHKTAAGAPSLKWLRRGGGGPVRTLSSAGASEPIRAPPNADGPLPVRARALGGRGLPGLARADAATGGSGRASARKGGELPS